MNIFSITRTRHAHVLHITLENALSGHPFSSIYESLSHEEKRNDQSVSTIHVKILCKK